MSRVKSPRFKVIYNTKDITAEITPYLISISYKDAVEGKSDTVELELSNTSGVWTQGWYPSAGDVFQISMGIGVNVFNCGAFEFDELEWQVSPDVVTIKGIAAGIKTAVRTKNSTAHENKTLRQIAQSIADQNGLKLTGTITDYGQIARVEQLQETDLGFLARVSREYGHVFSVRAGAINFTDIYQLEALASAVSVKRTELLPGSRLKDSSVETYKKLHLVHFDPRSKKVLETDFAFPPITNVDGFTYNGIVKNDTKEVRLRYDNGTQGSAKAMAALHSGNSKQQSGRLIHPGNPYLLSGNNFDLEECDVLSGKYHITSSTHKVMVKGGYTTETDVKRVGFITIEKAKRKHPNKVKPVKVQITS